MSSEWNRLNKKIVVTTNKNTNQTHINSNTPLVCVNMLDSEYNIILVPLCKLYFHPLKTICCLMEFIDNWYSCAA